MTDEDKYRELDTVGPNEIADALDTLAGFVFEQLPRRVWNGEGHWPALGQAMVVRIAEVGRAIGVLLRAECWGEALVTTRTLYEHLVVLAWVGAAPDANLRVWVDAATAHERVLHDEARTFGISKYTEDERRLIANARKLGDLKQLARTADQFWSARLPQFRAWDRDASAANLLTLEGLYTGLYRPVSTKAHGTVQSYDDLLAPNGNRLILDRERPPTSSLTPLAVPMLALALHISFNCFTWPEATLAQELNDAFVS